MHSAPSVTYPVGRCAVHGAVLAVLSALGLLALGLLVALWPLAGAAWLWAGGAVWLLWSVWALHSWWCSPCGQLQWDARATSATALPGERSGGWRWHRADLFAADLERVEWVLDAQRTLLLRLHPRDERVRWVWLEFRRDPGHWDDLRRALTSHAGRA
jgi:toxin CptA